MTTEAKTRKTVDKFNAKAAKDAKVNAKSKRVASESDPAPAKGARRDLESTGATLDEKPLAKRQHAASKANKASSTEKKDLRLSSRLEIINEIFFARHARKGNMCGDRGMNLGPTVAALNHGWRLPAFV